MSTNVHVPMDLINRMLGVMRAEEQQEHYHIVGRIFQGETQTYHRESIVPTEDDVCVLSTQYIRALNERGVQYEAGHDYITCTRTDMEGQPGQELRWWACTCSDCRVGEGFDPEELDESNAPVNEDIFLSSTVDLWGEYRSGKWTIYLLVNGFFTHKDDNLVKNQGDLRRALVAWKQWVAEHQGALITCTPYEDEHQLARIRMFQKLGFEFHDDESGLMIYRW